MNKNLKRRLSSKIANKNGADFENELKSTAKRDGWVCLDVPDGCVQVSAVKFIRVKSPFDFAFAKNNAHAGQFVLCDAKSTASNRLPPGKIKEHQVNELHNFSNILFTAVGYIVNFETHGCVVFFDTMRLKISMAARKGLAPEDGLMIGNKFSLDLGRIFEAKTMTALGAK